MNKGKYQLEDYKLIKYQILQTYNLHHKNGMANSKPWFFNPLIPMSD